MAIKRSHSAPDISSELAQSEFLTSPFVFDTIGFY